MNFTISFFGPFRIATGHAGNGADDTVDPNNPLPGSSLKGLFRASAAALIGETARGRELIDAIFGSKGRGSAWAWSKARLVGSAAGLEPIPRARVSILPETSTARDKSLLFAEELWPDSATFEVQPLAPLDSGVRERHEVLLAIAGRAIQALGADRRRGLGWVEVKPATPELDVAIQRFLHLRAELAS